MEHEGHAVTTVATAQEAEDAVRHEPFDLAFLDLRLGGTSGIDLLPELLEQQPNLKVVVITAYASVETAVEAMKRAGTWKHGEDGPGDGVEPEAGYAPAAE